MARRIEEQQVQKPWASQPSPAPSPARPALPAPPLSSTTAQPCAPALEPWHGLPLPSAAPRQCHPSSPCRLFFLFLAARAFSSCGKRGLLSVCGAQASLPCDMWDLPRPGTEPVSPALAGIFLSAVPPGKSPCPLSLCPDDMSSAKVRCISGSSAGHTVGPWQNVTFMD